MQKINTEIGVIILKIIRCYASSQTAVNAKKVIQDLLVAELENILNCHNYDVPPSNKESSRGESA
jgi:hypothetical protein